MSLGKKPTIFVSSTCYDLKQIRNDIYSFFTEQLGYDILLSEYDSFPIDTNVDTVENCLRVVRERADILVLIVGCRYGYVNETGHSVTNQEYLTAQLKGIPIYAFVDKKILSILSLWRDNPTANYTSTVDNPKLFEFVDSFRNKDSLWSFGFESAKDIIDTLKNQLSYLFSDCLELRGKCIPKIGGNIYSLEGTALKTALLKPDLWEYKLLGQVLQLELSKLENYRRDCTYRISFMPPHHLKSDIDILDYLMMKGNQLLKVVDMLNTIIDDVIPKALGVPGVEGDGELIIYCAKRIIDIYKSVIDWIFDCRSIVTHNHDMGLIDSFCIFSESILNDIERFVYEYNDKIQNIPMNMPECEEPIEISITLKLNTPDLTEFNNKLNRLKQRHLIDLQIN